MSRHHKKIYQFFFLFFVSYSVGTFAQNSEDYWDKNFEGKTIRNIIINTLNVAESFDERENYKDSSSFKNLINSLHYKSRDWVVRERLLFKKGDKINLKELYESERLLRSSNLFVEVRINLHQSPSSNNEADVEVITKDRWTLTFLAKYDPGNKSGYFGLKDNNLAGFGHTADAVVTYNNDPAIGWGGRFRYTALNIKGSYIDAGLKIEANNRYSVKGISLTRPFITYTTEWIGGIELKWEQNTFDIPDSAGRVIPHRLSRDVQDLWVGKGFLLNNNGFGDRNLNLLTSLRVLSLNHNKRPYNPSQYRIFENSTILLFGIGLLSRDFYRDKFVEDFGVTEDIPYGGLLSVSTGPEKRELSSRWYLGFETIYANWYNDYGYISGRVGIGSFYSNDGWEQNTFNLNLLYHTYLYRWKIWKYRLFFNYDLLLGYDRLSGENIYLYSRTGLRGIEKNIPAGTKRMVMNAEARVFSPYEFLGFILGGITFADFGFISDSKESFFSSRFYQAYGAGLRIKNESIINAAFELVFVFNPYNPRNRNAAFSVLLSTNFEINIRQVGYSKPFVEPF